MYDEWIYILGEIFCALLILLAIELINPRECIKSIKEAKEESKNKKSGIIMVKNSDKHSYSINPIDAQELIIYTYGYKFLAIASYRSDEGFIVFLNLGISVTISSDFDNVAYNSSEIYTALKSVPSLTDNAELIANEIAYVLAEYYLNVSFDVCKIKDGDIK